MKEVSALSLLIELVGTILETGCIARPPTWSGGVWATSHVLNEKYLSTSDELLFVEKLLEKT